jgi:coenzyme PQQ synthesis protein D (PqqD)
MMSARVRFRDSVRVKLSADRGFLFDEQNGRVYSLNASAAVAAARIQAGLDSPAVVEVVVATFEVDEPTARRDFDRFTRTLVDEGLATLEEATHG